MYRPFLLKEKFYSEIKQYLYGIYECLDIGRTERLDKHYAEIQRNPALSSLYYKKALQFVKEEASRRLGGKEFAEMIPYFDTIISRFP